EHPAFAKMVAVSFQDLVKSPNVFVVSLEDVDLYAEYLASFPPGTNPLFKKRTEHDCSCCKQFIRRGGSVVTVNEAGGLSTVWDRAAEEAQSPYSVVAMRLRDIVRSASICDLYRVGEKEVSFGAVQSHSLDKETQQAHTWQHLYSGEIPRNLRVASPDQVRGDYRTTVQVFQRGLVELSAGSVETVLSLVDAKALYRGEEHKPAL